MQEKYGGNLELVSIVLTDEDEVAATAFALRRYRTAVELDAITTDEETRDLLPERLDEISGLADRLEAGEREIEGDIAIGDVGSALSILVENYRTALTDTRLYDEMVADVPNRAEFLVHVATAQRMLYPPDDSEIAMA